MILITYGTRPEYIKIKPLIDELINNNIPYKTLFTGQHKDIAPEGADYNLSMVEFVDNRLNNIINNCLSIPDEYFEGITHVLVQGDTTSVVGLALNAMNRNIKIIHLEAGLRSGDVENPYPEEFNRKIVSSIANIHLCPTNLNKENLERENVFGEIFVVGNTVLDNLVKFKNKCSYENKVLVTLHRRENHELISEWFKNINDLAIQYPDIEFILPIHPNPNVLKFKHLLTNVTVCEPLQHIDLIKLLISCKLVITDSGGLQEECSFFNKKCLVCRKTTERPESVGITSFMVESPDLLHGLFDYHYNSYENDSPSPYGDGESSKIICDILKKII